MYTYVWLTEDIIHLLAFLQSTPWSINFWDEPFSVHTCISAEANCPGQSPCKLKPPQMARHACSQLVFPLGLPPALFLQAYSYKVTVAAYTWMFHCNSRTRTATQLKHFLLLVARSPLLGLSHMAELNNELSLPWHCWFQAPVLHAQLCKCSSNAESRPKLHDLAWSYFHYTPSIPTLCICIYMYIPIYTWSTHARIIFHFIFTYIPVLISSFACAVFCLVLPQARTCGCGHLGLGPFSLYSEKGPKTKWPQPQVPVVLPTLVNSVCQ